MTSTFEILPAIDLRGGRVVRLEQGDFARETAYPVSPVETALAFVEQGASWLHVVDLDGARTAAPANATAIAAIVAAVGARATVEVAGGLRDAEAVGTALRHGATRVVIGTAALDDPSLVERLVDRHGPERIVVALDVRDGLAVGHGWADGTKGAPVTDALRAASAAGVTTFEVTAIDRDGLLGGPDLGLYERLVGLGTGSIIASAGVSTVQDIAALVSAGCAGAIVGRALYEGRLDIASALAAAATAADAPPPALDAIGPSTGAVVPPRSAPASRPR